MADSEQTKFDDDDLPENKSATGENQEFACEMIVSHSVWHIEEQGRLMPTVYLRPRAGCTADAFRKIGWHEA